MDEFVRKPKEPRIKLDMSPEEQTEASTFRKSNKSDSSPEPRIIPQEQSVNKNKNGRRMPKFKIPVPKTKKQWIIASIAIFIILIGTVFVVYWFIVRDTSTPVAVRVEPIPVADTGPTAIYSTTSGREVQAAVNERPIYAVQVENSPEARPQSGLNDADIVSEAIAEGGITRFNAVFHDNIPANIGPVRSLRPYYIDWFMPYDAAIVHAGGSGEALANIVSLNLKDIDHGNSSSVFRRVSNRYAPHNLYTTGNQVLELMAQRGYTSNVSKSLARKTAEPSATANANNISINMSRALYNVNFVYDSATGRYLRSQGGGAHVDADTKQQLAPNVVVVPIMGRRTHPDRVHTVYDTVGSGKVFVFQDGTVTEGTWTKSSQGAQWELKDASGTDIKLNPGQTWFTITESADRVSYTP